MDDRYNRLSDAVRCVIESYDYMNIRYKSDVNYKSSACVHGNTMYTGCEICVCEFLQKALEETNG